MIRRILRAGRAGITFPRLPPAARVERETDRSGLPQHDPGIHRAIAEGIGWICRAQDNSVSHDGGVARHFSLLSGWGPSYPETTGYIVDTMLTYARLQKDDTIRQRAKRMLDWLISVQFPNGSFQGGPIGAQPLMPVSFNTGQILIGLAAGTREFADYRESLGRAADWLIATQDPDGCWRKYSSPFATLGEKTYDTHVAWALLEAARIVPDKSYANAAIANVRWSLSLQHENGWFENCCLTDPSQPLTHTLGYALRGLIEAYRFTNDVSFLSAAVKTAIGLLTATREDGFLPGRLRANWRGTVEWVCLTGTAQVVICWLLLYQITGEVQYREAGYAANRYLRRTLKVDGPLETRGGIKGSFPVYGGYGTYQYLSWAAKFFTDANLLEDQIRES